MGMSKLTHIDDTGAARMVDVSQKDITRRTAIAGGRVFMQPETFAALMEGMESAAWKAGVMELRHRPRPAAAGGGALCRMSQSKPPTGETT